MVGGAAGENDDPAQVAELLVGQAEALEHEVSVADTVAERLLDRVRLLVDLLQHESLVAGLLGRLLVPVDLERLALDLAVPDVEEARAVGGDRNDLAVVDQLELSRFAKEGRGRRGEEHLALADADEQRALQARSHELLRVVVVDDDEGEVAFELLVRLDDSLGQVAAVVPLDEVGDDLCVGLRAEAVPLGLERILELAEVLDDPVEDDRDLLVVAAGQRVRVLLGDAAVGSPARVAETRRRGRAVVAGRLLQGLEIADRANVVESFVLAKCEPGRVVAAVFEPLETAKEELLRLPLPDVSDDPAHLKLSLRSA